jgi:hypothetical protein
MESVGANKDVLSLLIALLAIMISFALNPLVVSGRAAEVPKTTS